MIKLLIRVLAALWVAFLYTQPVYAHPGRTASDGCHYCRTNCDKWGEAWGERHCHGALPPPPPTASPTTYIPKKPTPTNTPTPTLSPTSTPAPSVTSTPTPTDKTEPKVLGETKRKEETTSGTILTMMVGIIGFLIVFWRAINQKWPFHPKP